MQRCRMIFKAEFVVILRTKSAYYHPAIDLWLEAYV